MKTLLVNPPWLIDNRYGVRAGSRWPFTVEFDEKGKRHYVPFPFFLAYAVSLLKRYGEDAAIIDAVADDVSEELFFDKVVYLQPQVLVIETSTPSFENDLWFAEKIKEMHGKVNIVFCGPHVSTFYSEVITKYNFIDYILIGEYEQTLLELIMALDKRKDLKDIPALVYRENNSIRINNKRRTIKNLDDLPWPERDTLPIYNYNDGFCGMPRPNVQILGSRGCTYRCIFCLWPQVIYGEHLYRKRNPVDIADEIEWLIDKYKFKSLYFDDDVFNLDKRHTQAVCKEIKKRKIRLPWAIMARPDLMDAETLEDLASAGLFAVKYGIESTDEHVLNFCKKDMNIDKARLAIELTKKLGIKVHLTFCLGLPGETLQTIRKTERFIDETKPDSIQISYATPFPGTAYFEYLKNNNWLYSNNWSDYDGNRKCIVRTKDLSSKDLEAIKSDFSSHCYF